MLLHNKESCKQGQLSECEKIITNEMIDKGLISKRQETYTTQHQINKQPEQKVGTRFKLTFFQRRHMDD